jgi:hypothetical protein
VKVKDSNKKDESEQTLICWLDKLECECGRPQVARKICPHQAYCAPRFAVDSGPRGTLCSLLDEHDTLERWRSQYGEDVGDYDVPGTAMLDALERDTDLLVPVAAPIKGGAPSKVVRASKVMIALVLIITPLPTPTSAEGRRTSQAAKQEGRIEAEDVGGREGGRGAQIAAGAAI